MKKLLIISVLVVFLSPVLAVGAGQSDSTTLENYLDSFFSRTMSGYTTPWDLDPDTSNVRQAINDALLDISDHPDLIDATSSTDTIITDSTRWYSWPDDCYEIKWVGMADPSKYGETGLSQIKQEDIGKGTSASATHPKSYVIDGRTIYFDPNNTEGDTIYVHYRPHAAQLDSNSAVSNVSKKYKNIAVDLAIIYFFQGRKGADVAGIVTQAKERILVFSAKLKIRPESILPDIK